jgi:hypothetical protein
MYIYKQISGFNYIHRHLVTFSKTNKSSQNREFQFEWQRLQRNKRETESTYSFIL